MIKYSHTHIPILMFVQRKIKSNITQVKLGVPRVNFTIICLNSLCLLSSIVTSHLTGRVWNLGRVNFLFEIFCSFS